MIKIKQTGDFSKLTSFLEKLKEGIKLGTLDKYGRKGVEALEKATPKRTGTTSKSWFYDIVQYDGGVKLVFYNSNVNQNVNIAVILQYGHGTKNGGYVQGIDYINPSLKPVFNELADSAWKEVVSK